MANEVPIPAINIPTGTKRLSADGTAVAAAAAEATTIPAAPDPVPNIDIVLSRLLW